MPAAAARSRKRRKSSASKKNWVMQRSAPASTLRLRLSRSASRRRIGMLLGIARDADLEVADLLQAGHQLGGIGVAAGMGGCTWRPCPGRIAAQRHDVADAGVPVGARDVVDLARVAPTQVSGRPASMPVSLARAAPRLVRALARRAAGAVGHREEVGAAATAGSPPPTACARPPRSWAARTRTRPQPLRPSARETCPWTRPAGARQRAGVGASLGHRRPRDRALG